MQIMLGDKTGDALAMLNIRDRRDEAAGLALAAQNGGQMGNVWLALANYVSAPPKGGTQIIRPASPAGIKPEHLAVGAAAALAAYLALG
jgi:hypothetical protein